MDMLQINLLQNSSIISIILAIKNAAKQRQKLFLMERKIIEKRIRYRKLLAARILRSKRRRIFRRSCWIQPELALDVIGKYWEEQVPLYTDERFYKKFRMSRNSFNKLCEDLHPYLFKLDTQFRTAISVPKRIAIALIILKGRNDIGTVADLFHVGKSTVPYILYEFCDAVIMHYSHLIKFPSTEEERAEIGTGFWNQWQFYDCFGAMDGTHIPILCPKASVQDYYNYKSFNSINVLAIVDHKYRFTYAVIGAPGRCNDASILRRSTLFKNFDNNGKDPKMKTKFHLISDAAFPLLSWIMKPYRGASRFLTR